jgi:mRNA-degrading endonuclease YafQ of YafQ-DinJ toxin-antitoxin module
MEIFQTRRFKRVYKKLHQNQLASDLRSATNAALQEIIDNPEIGEQKKGDLSWLRVHKFQIANRLTLIGYCIEPERRLTFVDIGSHNFY